MKKSKDYKISILLGLITIVILMFATVPLFYNQFNSSMLLLEEKTIDDFKDEERIAQIYMNSQLSIRSNKLSQFVNNTSLKNSLESDNKQRTLNILNRGMNNELDADFLFLTYDGLDTVTDVSLNILDSKEIIKEYLDTNYIQKGLELFISKNYEVVVFTKEEIVSSNTGRVLATIHSGYIITSKIKFINGLSEKINNHNVYFLANNKFVSGTKKLEENEIREIQRSEMNQLTQVGNKLFYIGNIPIDNSHQLKVVFETSSNYFKTLKSSYILNFGLTILVSLLLCGLAMYIGNHTITPPLENLLQTINTMMIRNIHSEPKKSIIREFNVIEKNFIEVYNNFQKKKSQLAKFIDSSPTSILVLDYTGNIIQTNKAAIEFFGINNLEGNILLDNSIAKNSEFNQIFSTLKERPDKFEAEINFKSEDRWKHTTWIFTQDKKENYIFIQCIDNTEKVEAQAEIEAERSKSIHNQKLAAIGEVASSIAHEVNNPMGIISLSVAILEHELGFIELQNKKKRDRISKTIKNIENSVARTSKIVSNLLDFSREGSKDKLERKNLNTILTKTLIFIEEKMKKNKVELDIEKLSPSIEVLVKETQFSQVLVNLINNSIDALTTSQVKKIEIYTEVKKDKCIIHFKDTGSGIPKEIQSKIFSPFYTTKEKGKGTGLGLSISRQLLVEMSGDLHFISEESGAHFIVSIPLGRS